MMTSFVGFSRARKSNFLSPTVGLASGRIWRHLSSQWLFSVEAPTSSRPHLQERAEPKDSHEIIHYVRSHVPIVYALAGWWWAYYQESTRMGGGRDMRHFNFSNQPVGASNCLFCSRPPPCSMGLRLSNPHGHLGRETPHREEGNVHEVPRPSRSLFSTFLSARHSLLWPVSSSSCLWTRNIRSNLIITDLLIVASRNLQQRAPRVSCVR